MKINLLLTLIIISLLPFSLTSQEELHLDGGCQFDTGSDEEELFGFGASNEAWQIVHRITETMHIQEKFILKSANVANAKASSSGGQRYILYNTSFLERFKGKPRTSFWGAYCVLAHEIGHHYNNDNFLETDQKRRKIAELSADRFAGYVLRQMGASLDEAIAGIKYYSLDAESSTHPPKTARLEAVANGWKQAKEQVPYATDLLPPNAGDQSVKELYDKGVESYNAKRYSEAVASFDQIIRLKGNFAAAYLRRGDAKQELKQYRQAISDYDEAIRIKPGNGAYYINRGLAKSELGRYQEAISDYDDAIRLIPNSSTAYNNRGVAKRNLNQLQEALVDYTLAIQYEPENYQAYSNRAAIQNELRQFQEALADCAEALRIKSNYPEAYFQKGATFLYLKQFQVAIDNYSEAIRLKPDFKEAYNNRGNTKQRLKQFEEAIFDYNEAIKLDPRDADYFFNRGNAYYNLSKYDEAFRDYEWAIQCDPNHAGAYGNQGCVLLHLDDPSRLDEALLLLDTALAMDNTLESAKSCREDVVRLLKRK